ncbi:MAG: copper amine oxidase N-terminal domain-containing protein, partial [bacterium]
MRNFIKFLKFQKFQKKECKSFKLFSSTYALIYTLVCTLMLSSIFNFTTFADSIPYVSLDLRYDGEDHKYYQPKVYLEIDGKILDDEDLPLEPVLIEERTLVPAREVFEEVGAEVEWVQDEYMVRVTYEDIVVRMYIDTLNAYKTGID